jgi:hypothetical protein
MPVRPGLDLHLPLVRLCITASAALSLVFGNPKDDELTETVVSNLKETRNRHFQKMFGANGNGYPTATSAHFPSTAPSCTACLDFEKVPKGNKAVGRNGAGRKKKRSSAAIFMLRQFVVIFSLSFIRTVLGVSEGGTRRA